MQKEKARGGHGGAGGGVGETLMNDSMPKQQQVYSQCSNAEALGMSTGQQGTCERSDYILH